MATASAAGLPYSEHRTGSAPTLVFLHYWGGSSRTWREVLDFLPHRDVLTVDLRGWQRSAGLPGPYTLDRYADDVLALIADRRLQAYLLIGHSMGGKVAQLVRARKPEGLRGVVLIGSGPARPAEEITPEYQEQLSHAYDTVETVSDAVRQVLTATPLQPEVLAQVIEDSRSSTSEAARLEWPLRGIAEDISDLTEQGRGPVLVIGGEHDQVEPIEVLRRNLLPYVPGARFEVVPRTGHLMPLEVPQPLAELIDGFVDSLGYED